MLYKEMTAAQRKAAYEENAEAVELHIQQFALRPFRGSRYCIAAERHANKCEREMNFIKRIAKSCGDEWATEVVGQ